VPHTDGDVAVPCRTWLNGSVECERYVYTSVDQWRAQRDKIEHILHAYRRRIVQLKVCYAVQSSSWFQPVSACVVHTEQISNWSGSMCS